MTTVPIAAPAIADQVEVRIFTDILNALSQYPAIAEAVRQHVLSDEIRHLPAAFVQLAATVERYMEQTNRILAELQAGQARHDADIADLKDGQARLEAGQSKLEAGQSKLEAGQSKLEAGQARLGAGQAKLEAGQEQLEAGQARLEAGQSKLEVGYLQLAAKFLPYDIQRMTGEVSEVLDVRRIVWLDSTTLVNIVDDARDKGDDVPLNERQSFYRVDGALRAISRGTREIEYAVIECSNTVTDDDITRIRRNADLMARFTGCRTHAMVAGNVIPERVRLAACEAGVHPFWVTDKVSRAT